MHLAVFDFDGTLFASPLRPSWWPWQGFWGRPESLSPPYVPERPDADWWVPGVVAAAKKAISDPGTYTVLLTGRPPKLSHRIKELLHGAGLRFDEYHFSNDDTLTFKVRVIESLVGKLQPESVTLWEDREEHLSTFDAALKALGTDYRIRRVPRATHAFLESTPLKVASAWSNRIADVIGDPRSLIQKFEDAVEKLAVLEKALPATLDMDKLWKKVLVEAKARGVYEETVWKEFGLTDEQLRGVTKFKALLVDFVLKVKFSSHLFQQAQASYLFLGILQQYDLPPRTRKVIEAAAKYHAKRRNAPSKEKAVETYIKMMAEVRTQLAAAKEAITQGRLRSSPPPEAGAAAEGQDFKAGPFKLVNTGGFDAETMKEAGVAVETAANLLKGKGISRVLYGDVLVSRTLSRQNVLAFYLTQKDELFVRANLRGKQHDAVRTICHELGHRLHFKFLKDKDREIRGIYAQIARKSGFWTRRDKIQEVLKEHPVLPGDTFEGKGKVYEVVGTSWKGKGLVVDLVRKPELEPRAFGELPPSPATVEKAYIPLEGYLMAKGLLTHQDLSGFVTPYAAKNHEENFAEMIAFWCQDRLPEDQVELLKGVL